MKRNFLMLFCLFLFLVLPVVASADCMRIGVFDRFTVTEDGGVLLYAGPEPIVKLEVSCNVLPTSTIRILNDFVCAGDDILIDGSS